nr:CHAT domain-containing protein [Endozoicomonas sp.]
NIWQSRNCRMALSTIIETMEQLQDQFSPYTHSSERVKLVSTIVLAAQLHRYNPMSHSLAIRKIKRDAEGQPYSQELNRMLTIGEEQNRLRMQLRDTMATSGNPSAAAQLSQEMENLTQEYNAILTAVQKKYPDSVAPRIPAPIHPASIMQNLSNDEAVILWAVEEDYRSQAIVITREWIQAVALPTNYTDIEQLVNEARKTLDQPDTRSAMDIRPFAMDSAYQLYQKVFEPLQPYLKGKKKLYLLPDGPLAKLPFQVLPTRLPDQAITSPLDFMRYRSVSWLGDDYLMNYQPSLNNLYEQLTTTVEKKTDNSERLAYAGFGNPVMPQTEPDDKGSNLLIAARDNLKDIRQRLQSSFNFMGDSTLENLSRLPPLPKTEQQLRSIGQILGDDDYIYVGKSATLDQLQQLPLSRFQTLVFATHGLMAGKNLPEPGLVMTPVDGDYSTAILDSSTIAGLELDADRVILSACNTAELGRDNGLASLSTAFFQAGARSLVVSHWSTEQSATTDLMVKLFQQLEQSPEQGLTVALRQAARDMRDNDKNMLLAHPMFWAPFVAIGRDL